MYLLYLIFFSLLEHILWSLFSIAFIITLKCVDILLRRYGLICRLCGVIVIGCCHIESFFQIKLCFERDVIGTLQNLVEDGCNVLFYLIWFLFGRSNNLNIRMLFLFATACASIMVAGCTPTLTPFIMRWLADLLWINRKILKPVLNHCLPIYLIKS